MASRTRSWKRSTANFLREVWKDRHNLVSIRTTTDVRRPFLLPEQKYFLRENLRLMLYGEQVALLHGDIRTVELNVNTARQWLQDYYDTGTPAVKSAVGRAIHETAALGCELIDIDLPYTDYAVADYYIIAPAEASSNHARRRRALRVQECRSAGSGRMYAHSGSEGFGSEVKRRIMIGTYALSSGYYEAYYGAQQVARRAR